MVTKILQQNIPKGWQRVKLGDVLIADKGRLPKKLFLEKSSEDFLPYLTIKTMSGKGIEYGQSSEGVAAKKDDLLVIADGSRSGYLFTGHEGLVSSTFLRIRTKNEQVGTNSYFYQLFHHLDFTSGKFRKGGAIPHFDFKQLNNLDILLPSISEQKKITEILGAVDEEIKKTDEIISSTKKLKKGLMQRLFTHGVGHTKFKLAKDGEILDDCRVFKLGNIATITRGSSPRPIQSYITESSDGLNWLRIGDIDIGAKYVTRTSQKIKATGLSKTTLVKEGDFILSNSMSFGRPYIMKIEACIHDGWLAFKNIKADLVGSEFLYYLLTSPLMQSKFWAAAAGSGVKNLKRETVANIFVTLPSVKEQQKIASILSSVDNKISVNKNLKTKLNLLKKGLMQDLLSGNKRVNI